MLTDLRAVLGELEGGSPVRRAPAAAAAGVPAETPMPELGIE